MAISETVLVLAGGLPSCRSSSACASPSGPWYAVLPHRGRMAGRRRADRVRPMWPASSRSRPELRVINPTIHLGMVPAIRFPGDSQKATFDNTTMPRTAKASLSTRKNSTRAQVNASGFGEKCALADRNCESAPGIMFYELRFRSGCSCAKDRWRGQRSTRGQRR